MLLRSLAHPLRAHLLHPLGHLHRRAELATCARLHVHRTSMRHHRRRSLLLLRVLLSVLRLPLALAVLRPALLLLLRVLALRLLRPAILLTRLARWTLLLHVRHRSLADLAVVRCKVEGQDASETWLSTPPIDMSTRRACVGNVDIHCDIARMTIPVAFARQRCPRSMITVPDLVNKLPEPEHARFSSQRRLLFDRQFEDVWARVVPDYVQVEFPCYHVVEVERGRKRTAIAAIESFISAPQRSALQ